EAIAFLDRLLPHLQRACRIGQSHFVYSTEALVGHTLVDRLRQPVVLMTSAGEVVHVNDATGRLLAATTLVRIENKRLLLPQHYHDEFFKRCAELEQAIRTGEPGAPEQSFNSIHIKHELDGDEVLYGFFNALLPERVMGTFGVRPLIMLFLYHPSSAQVIDSSLLSAAFGLSHAECRVASLLAEGMPLKSIADTLGVQYDTVRKQLMSIYKKTSTNRQPELVRLLLHLPAAAPQVEPALGRKNEGKKLT
ncbi:MAG TPA: helix-turn-helix transcriptional regulator, partial [Telluria sp.]|nr:helix-turn-helix transcriptional regulator [Telluria sp.]